MLERGQEALSQVSETYLPSVVRWLELLAELKDNPEIEPEEIWLLATGELKKMDDEMEDAAPLEDWRRYLDGL
jgi:hypothetical protein